MVPMFAVDAGDMVLVLLPIGTKFWKVCLLVDGRQAGFVAG